MSKVHLVVADPKICILCEDQPVQKNKETFTRAIEYLERN